MKFRRTLGISLLMAIVLLLVMHGTALALVEQLTIDELTAKADSIVVGEVIDMACYEESRGDIYTLVTLSVEQSVKGKSAEEVVLKVPGGEVDGLTLSVSDTPSFRQGERVVVFLEEETSKFKVSGWHQGKFTVVNNRVVERDQSLTDFIAEIGQAMEAQGMSPILSVQPSSLTLESPLKNLPANPPESEAAEPPVTREDQTGWENIMTENFDSGFPNSTWTLIGTPTWDDEDYRYRSADYSCWCAGSTLDPSSDDYANNMNAWMIYGPFSLSDASDADLTFYLWLECPAGDYIRALASTDGLNYYGSGWYGSTGGGWSSMELDLTNIPTLRNLCGQSQVYIAFLFQSNSSGTDYGAFIDDVVLRKYVGTPPQITAISPDTGPAGTGFSVNITGTDFGTTQGSSTVTFWRVSTTYEEATIVSWSDTEIVCEVPSGASSGSTTSGVRVNADTGPSNDYPFTVTFSYGLYKWPGDNPMGEDYLVNPNTSDCDGELAAVQAAAQTWNDVDGANFNFVYGTTTSATDYSYNNFNEIMWVGYNTGSIATCYTWYSGSTILENDIVFNDYSYTWDTSGSPAGDEFDVQNIAVHELGHCLNLKDLYGTADSEKTMYGYGSTGETKKRTLADEDKAGIRWIYADWDSYRIGYPDDSGVLDDTFSDPGTEHIVYMYGTSFSGTYKVIFWDASGSKAKTDDAVLAVGGVLKNQHTFVEGVDAAGDWHVTVYPTSANPLSYSAADLNIIADDISYTGNYAFNVTETAIPEFPTIIAAVLSLGLCGGVYLWMRRKVVKDST